MTDKPDGLDDELRAYYAQLSRGPAPDLTDKVMLAAGNRTARLRRLGAAGGAIAVAAVVVALVVVGLANHGRPTAAPGQSSTPLPSYSATPTVPTPTPSAPTPTVTPQPTAVVPVAPPVHGFVPTDVTAISADEWWVLGYNGPSCSSASCTRILHTTDGGHTFTSIPVPPVAPAQTNQQALQLRFDNAADGWVVTAGGDIWATHDGGAHWTDDAMAHQVTDLEASGSSVYAITCQDSTSCWIQKSGLGHDGWTVLPGSEGSGHLSHLNVNGSHLWAAIDPSNGATAGSLLTSTDGGQSFSPHPVCSPDLGFASVYAVDSSVLWVTCPTGTQAAIYRSADGGQHFTNLGNPGIPNSASIAGVSATTAVVAAAGLLRTVDGGHSFTTVAAFQGPWWIIGFTTASNGFAFDMDNSLQRATMWRTNDAGATWFMVQFP